MATSKLNSPRRSTISKRSGSPSRLSVSPKKVLDKLRFIDFIKKKLDFSEEVYNLLAEMSENYSEAQTEIYNLIPNFQLHAKYLAPASECIRRIIGTNWLILHKISKTVKFSFDLSQPEDQKFNILINIIDQPSSETPENQMKFSKQDKLTSKPINLINYYMNMVWDSQAVIKQDYIRFLRSLCRFGEKGININQEMIYKLYNCMIVAKQSNPFVSARV